MSIQSLDIFNIQDPSRFNKEALDVFRFQSENNNVYKSFIKALKIDPTQITEYNKIPFLPIEFFKTQRVISSNKEINIEKIFTSSGTTGLITSSHYVTDLQIYEESFMRAFTYFYGDIKECCVLCLLPSYLEREGSSLVYMAQKLVKESNHVDSGFYIHNYSDLIEKIKKLRSMNQKSILLGVTYALLDLADMNCEPGPNCIVMETGGMKGKRKEMVREELHAYLKSKMKIDQVHSEYGMTELLSQAYSKGDGLFFCPPWMKVLIRDMNDPLQQLDYLKTGAINVIDLANVNSCSFIATKDLGKSYANGGFEILGRFDNSDIRGCNLMVQ